MIENILARFKKPRLSKKQSCSVGLDIGSTYVKLVELQINDGQIQLKRASYSAINPESDLAALLGVLLRSQGVNTQQVNTSLSGAAVVMRSITLPRMSPGELKGAVQFEAKRLIPFPLEEMVLDFAIIQEKAKDNKMQIVVAAAKKSLLQERIQLLEKAGLIPKIIDIDCFCLANAFTHSYALTGQETPQGRRETIGLLNIGARLTNLVVLENGSLKFSRDIGFGCQESALSSLIAEISSSIDYYENQIGLPIEKIYLSGGVCFMPSVREFVSSHLDAGLVNFDVFAGIAIDAQLGKEELTAKQGIFAVALGLALR
jgi:Tfp pilus assembly PilM family ATPase